VRQGKTWKGWSGILGLLMMLGLIFTWEAQAAEPKKKGP